MDINQMIDRLKHYRGLYGNLPVYTNGEPDLREMEVSGVRFADRENLDMDRIDLGEEPLPARVFLKI